MKRLFVVSAYYQPRNRYLAPKLLDTMMGLQNNGDRVLGFTTKDISLKHKEYENWGGYYFFSTHGLLWLLFGINK